MSKFFSLGLDAPNVVRNLLASSCFAFVLSIIFYITSSKILFWLASLYMIPCVFTTLFTAIWMLISSFFLKPKIIQNLVQKLELNGNELILDAGCGSGIFAIEAAKFLSTGQVEGIDIWRTQDQFRNFLKNTIQNIAVNDLQKKINIHTADMRNLPYLDEYFDCVVSSLAVHNIKSQKEQERTLCELLRVLKPGGFLAIFDIKNYVEFFKKQSVQIIETYKVYTYCPFAQVIFIKKIR